MMLLPGGRIGVLEIGHEDVGAGVQRVDDHLAVDGAGDFDAAVEKVGGDGRHAPFTIADVRRGWQKLRHGSVVDSLLPFAAGSQQLAPAGFEGLRQLGQEAGGFCVRMACCASVRGAVIWIGFSCVANMGRFLLQAMLPRTATIRWPRCPIRTGGPDRASSICQAAESGIYYGRSEAAGAACAAGRPAQEKKLYVEQR